MSDILTCQGGTLAQSVDGYPVCSGGTWELRGDSAFWDVVLSSQDIAQLLGAVCFLFALVWCFRILLRVILNKR